MISKNIEAAYPLSPMQQGMLFHTLYTPESGMYFQQLSCTFYGDLNVLAFQRAWQQVVDRHPVWRTAFVWENIEKPLQVVGRRVKLPWEQHDWRGLSPVEQQEKLEAFLEAHRVQGFKLSKAPLMRIALLQLDENTYQFVWSYHHLLLDGWSLSLVFKEVFAFYSAFCEGKNLQLERSRPYQDYIAWLQQQDLTKAETFWRQTLKGFTAPTPLGVDKALGSLSSEEETYDEQLLQLSVAVTSELQSFARQHQLTLNTLVQGAWALLLSRYSSQEDIVFGATVSGRPAHLAGVESMVGLFINTLPVRVLVSPTAELLSWLKQLQAQLLEQRSYEYSPLLQVQGWSDVPRGLPLFESIVVFENYPVDASMQKLCGSLEFRNIRAVERTNYPLTLVALPGPELSLQLLYDCRRFDAVTITRMLGHLQILLEGLVAQRDGCLASLPLLTQRERQQLLVEWNHTGVDYPQDLYIHQLFEAQVEQTPDAVAVVFEDKQLTYSELNCRANQVAHHLRSLGVGPDVLVGLCVERSLEMVLGILGILKAGGAYVPLDPAYPQERLGFMLEDSQVLVLLTQTQLVEKVPEHGARVVCLDTNWEVIAKQSKENLVSGVTLDHLTYVIYTSGSTGRPKGVLITHQGLVNYLHWCSNAYTVVEGQGSPVHSSLAFDLTVTSLFSSLIVGRSVLLIPDDKGVEALGAALQADGDFSLIKITPAHLEVLNQQLSAEVVGGRTRTLVIGGEALFARTVAFWQTYAPSTRLINEYGPTETVVGCCIYEVSAGVSITGDVPIGRPIANTQIYLLDDQLQPVPIGVPGEMYIGGAGVARGYLNRPELTAQRFIPNPFSQKPGARLYKTGDNARYLPNCDIEYLGRLDDQVKIRGFRIELGEIESVLSQHPAVQESVVMVREDVPGNKRLVAYVVVNQTPAPEIKQLQQFVKQKLPEYMVPAAIVLLETLPLTPNGKVDRRALPAPDTTRPELSDTFVKARTPVEEMVALVWADILGVQNVGIHDNFFELGGHSLLATQLVSRVRDTFCVELPLRALFSEPTVAALAERIETARRASLGVSAPPLVPISKDTHLPLSFAQARLWFLDQLEPGSAAYNIPAAVRLTGSLHVAALQQSFNEIVRRHETLRTTFTSINGKPVQAIAPVSTFRLTMVDLRELPQPQQSTEVSRLATLEAQRPFDLKSGPLLRATLLQLGAAEHVLLLVMHHIISDGWSMGVLIRELAALYEAYKSEKALALSELPIQYADFAHWQRQWLQGEVLQAQLEYWKQQLAGAPPVLELPTDRTRPAIQTLTGAAQFLALPEHLSQALKTLSQRYGVTLFMTLLAAFQTLLYRYTGQSDICVGSPIANRNRSETEALIGFFVNTLVLRTDLSGNPNFSKLLARVREVALDAYAHQDLPFEQLVEALQPERNLSHQPLFQVMFVLQNAPMPTLELPGLTLNPLSMDSTIAKFDLTLSMEDTQQELVGWLEYNSDLFDATTITRMLAHFQTLLEGIVADPQQRLCELPLLTQPERQQLLVEWNHTGVDYPKNVCIHQLFEAQVERTPDAVAVVFEDQILTYCELNRRANQLAHHLRSLGVGPDVLVGICVERSLEMVVGLLGILKAGGAYVPLDPAYPSDRLTFMLEDAQLPILLTQQKLEDKFAKQGTQVVCLDTNWELLAQESKHNPNSGVKGENLAYVIYTSGSTGRPKGVMISHQTICNHMFWMQRCFPLSDTDKVLQKTPFSFDASIWEFYAPLLVGAQLIIAQPGGHQDTVYLLKLIAKQQITTVQLVPSLLQMLLQEKELEACCSLKRVFCGGEALPAKLQERFFACVDAQLHNLYGPTEACIDSIFWTCHRETHQQIVPIGRPISNTQIYILDRELQPVPIGVKGELHIGGDCLARGYLKRPELTTERFIPNPFSNKPGARLYKTGDLARYKSNGNIEYLGRLDDQVKLRGFRIELGEIEIVLGQHPGVQETVVMVREDVVGTKRLVTYVVANQALTPTITELHHFLKDKLPEYMVPSAIMVLEVLPLTPNGKVDRRALPAPDTARSELAGALVAARTPVEKALALIWTEVLGLQQISIHDNFFELGGDSILSIQIIARANQAGLKLTPKQLFQHQTIAELALVAGTTSVLQTEQGLVTGAVLLTPIQRWFFQQEQPELHHWNQAMLLEVRQPLNPVLLSQVVQQLLVHHDALQLRFVRSASRWQQVNVEPDSTLSFCTRVDLSVLPEPEQIPMMEAAAAQLQASLNLEEGPLVRVALFDLGPNQPNRLLLILHHLAVDGVSWRILLEDLQTAYQQLSRGQAILLPPKTTSFQNWAQTLSEYAQSPALEQEQDYWLAQSWSGATSLPINYSVDKDANTVASANNVVVSLSSEQTRALLSEVPQAYNTQINDVLLTALAQAFAQWTDTRCLLVDLEGHGREEILEGVDLSRTVGWFTTLFPVLLDLRKARDPGSALKLVKEQLRRIPNRGIGYGLLRYLKGDVAITEKLQALPQAEVIFNYLGQLDRVLTPDAMFEAAKESSGPEHSLLSKRSHLLEINGIVTGGCLHLNWTYSEKVHKRSTVEDLAQSFVAALQKLIAHCQSPEAGGFTPSDFPLAKLDEQKLSKLAILIDKSDGSSTKIKNVEDIYPLSPMQQGMLFHTLYASNSGVYFEHLNCTLKGNLNVLAFKRVWQQVVDRHPVLRTAFIWEGLDEPLQLVRQHISLPWEQHDWRGLSPVKQQEQLEAYLQADRERGFDLSQAPLMRLTLIQLESDAYQFIWSHHHLLLDGWSLPLVLKNVFAFYQAFSLKQDLYLKHSRPYRDYIAWLQQQDLTQAEAFWRQALKGFSAPTPLGIERALDSISSLEETYSEQFLQLSMAVTSELQSFARQHQLTMNTLVQGAWALLLSRYSSQEDVVFGATVSGRPTALAEVESMVGLFINTLPVRVMVSPKAGLLSWLQQLQAQLLELRSYEYSPLVQVQGWSDVPRGLPLFESIVVFENYPVDASLREQGGSLEIGNVSAIEQTNYPLTLAAAPGEQLSLHLSYDCRRFDAASITRMLGHFQTLLCAIVAHPEQRLSDLPILTPTERQQLLVEWNHTGVDYPKDLCIHQLFEATVQRTPDAVAVVFEDQILSYCELNRRANQLTHYLRSLGVGPDVLVGICVQRSVEMVVGLLGILKAGGAYLPLDPAYPSERLAFMLEDSQVSVLLTQQRLMAALPVHSAQVVQLDGDWETIAHNSEANPLSPVSPQQLAYVIYTSGSTGQPKGVLVAHQGLVNHCVAVAKHYGLESRDRILQFSSISFDIAVEELFPSWMSGATVILRSEDKLADSSDFLQAIEHEQLTVLNLPTAYWHQWVHNLSLLNKPLPQTLRLVVVGGEKASPTTFSTWRQLAGVERIRWLNSYGPTETTVTTTVYEPETNPTTQELTLELPIGRPIANTQIYLLDQHLEPVPVGVPGELYISGAGLARGYLNRPELTAQRFIPNPFSQKPGARFYKTGDNARYLPNGDIEYLGRVDDQVKIRGFRIELGEIEAVLNQHPAVQETVLMAREDVPGNKRLVAYVVVNQTPAPEIKQLQHFVKQKLPEYMVPSAIVLLPVLPLTPNGKVNRQALPAPDALGPELQEARIAPRDTLELQLAQIWESVLDVRSIGVTDNFFSLGGHSLLAMRLMAHIQQQFGQNLSLATLFQAPTIEQLASTISQQTGSLHWSPVVEIQPRGSKQPFFCVPGAGGHVLSFYNLARHLGKDQPFYGLQPRGFDGEQAPHTQVEDMAAYYIEALQSVQPQGPYLLGGYSFGGHVAFEMALQLQSSGQEVALLAILDTPAPVPSSQPIAVEKDDARYLTDLAILIEHFSGKSLSVSYDDIQPLQPDEQLNYLLERLKMVNFLPPEATLPQFRGYLQVLKANDQTVYVPKEVYRNRITLLRTSEQLYDDLAMGWDKVSFEQVQIHDVPGDHITMLTEPHVQLLAKQLRACLDQAQADD